MKKAKTITKFQDKKKNLRNYKLMNLKIQRKNGIINIINLKMLNKNRIIILNTSMKN